MAKAAVIEDRQFEHMIKATSGYSRTPERDVALLFVLYGTAMATTELATKMREGLHPFRLVVKRPGGNADRIGWRGTAQHPGRSAFSHLVDPVAGCTA